MIYINGTEWGVEIVSPFHPSLLTPEGTIALGCCDDWLKTIFVNGNQSKAHIKRTLAHEIVHAIMYSYNIDIDDYTEEILATYGEDLVFLSNMIYKKLGLI